MSAARNRNLVEMHYTKLITLAAFSILIVSLFSGRAAGQQPSTPTREQLVDSAKLQTTRAALQHEIEVQGQTSEQLYGKAKALFQERNYAASIATLESLFGESAASLDISNLEAWRRHLDRQQPDALTLMGMNHVLLGNLSQAEPFLVVAAGKQPSEPSAQFRLALLYYTTNRFSQAAGAARTVIRLKSSFGKAYEILGLSLEELRRGPEAIASLRKAIAVNLSAGTTDPSPYISLAKALLNQTQYAESGVLLRQALKLDPNSDEASFLLGKVLYKLESYAESELFLRRSIALSADYAEPRYLLSLLLSRQGRSDEAQTQMEVFLGLHDRRPKKASLSVGIE